MLRAQLLIGLTLTVVALAACSNGGSASAPTGVTTTTAGAPSARATAIGAAPTVPALATLIPGSINSELDKACAVDCLTAFDIGYLGGLIERGLEIAPPYQNQAQYIKIGEAVCARLSEGYTMSQILATAASPGDRQKLELMAESAQLTYCTLPRFGSQSSQPVVPAGVTCSPLPAAMTVFDQKVRAALPSGRIPTTGSSRDLSDLTNLVIEVVDRCGYQMMIDIANQYPNPFFGWLRSTAASALGEISALPGGLRCADLAASGLGPKQAVDYWFFWGAPGIMDADKNGIPCETIWPNVARYMPSNH